MTRAKTFVATCRWSSGPRMIRSRIYEPVLIARYNADSDHEWWWQTTTPRTR
jgi:hypothetical protein